MIGARSVGMIASAMPAHLRSAISACAARSRASAQWSEAGVLPWARLCVEPTATAAPDMISVSRRVKPVGIGIPQMAVPPLLGWPGCELQPAANIVTRASFEFPGAGFGFRLDRRSRPKGPSILGLLSHRNGAKAAAPHA